MRFEKSFDQRYRGHERTLTQVPPRPHVEPCVEGLTKSKRATRAPARAASLAAAKPPEPPPMTMMS